FLLLFEGVIQGLLVIDGRTEPAGRHVAPTWLGAIPVLTETPFGARLTTDSPSRIGRIAPADFERLILTQPVVHRRVMRQLRPVKARISAINANRERLAGLGTMAAGLAHELNNPAAAARRAAADLRDALDVLGSTISSFVRS